ncbi:MAG: WD40/YVTN/BNR-like repeat-containing protein [Oscillospiraceae bacterium]
MAMKKKIFAAVSSLCIAGVFSSCSLDVSEIKNIFNKTEAEPQNENTAVVADTSDDVYQWDTLDISGGGYVAGIVCNKTEKGLMYARTENGGAFRYDTELGEWISMTDFLKSDESGLMSVESIATDNSEPNRVYMVCGSLDGNENGAIFSSEDYGNTWKRFDLSFKCGGDAEGRGCGERLAIDPNDNKTIYYGSRSDGMWKSGNYGETWTLVPSFNTTGNFAQNTADIGIMWVLFDEESGGKGSPTLNIYAGVADVEGYTVYKSENTGITWDAVDTGLAGLYPVQAEMASDGKIYMVFNNNATPEPDPGNGAVYVYNPQKNEFKNISPTDSTAGSGFGAISVDSENPNIIAVSTLGYHYPKENIYITYDAGESWKSFYDSENDYFETESDENDIGTSITALCIDPNDRSRIIFGNDKGVFEASGTDILNTEEEITKKIKINNISDGLSIMSVQDMAYSKGKLYCVSTKFGGFAIDNTSEAVSLDESFDIKGSVDIDCAWNNNELAVMCGEQQILFTDCGGLVWYSTAALPTGYDKLINGSVCISADGSAFIWSPDDISSRPVITEDFGQTWNICEGLPSGAYICADRVNKLKYYAVSENSFYVSADGGMHFRKTLTNISENSTIAVSQSEGVVWICGKEVYYSTDSGENFEKMENLSAECMTFGENISGTEEPLYPIYISGSIGESPFGIYRSDDNGHTWQMISDTERQFGMKANAIAADAYDKEKIYIATDGRGILTGSPKTE